MNRSKLHSLRNMAAALLMCAGFTACSQDDLADTQGETLPPGKYPLELTAAGLGDMAVPANAPSPSTRGTVDNDWDGVQNVGVRVNDNERNMKYKVEASGDNKTACLTPEVPLANDDMLFWWTSTDEKKTITAWHPYSSGYPEKWQVKANQSQTDNYQASDLIIGELTGLTFENRNTPMTFHHQTAKVVVNLTADEGVTFDENTAVQLKNLTGIEGGGNKITPYQQNDKEYTYLALLAPQEIQANRQFIQVTVNGTNFYYTPKAEKQLDKGTAYTYTITVKADGLEVTEATGGEWTNDSSENVASNTIYTADDLKFGDYYYSDGTRSDGGLRKLYADGTMEWAEILPEPERDKTVIGIVFHAGQHENDKSDYSSTSIGQAQCHGYVVSLQDATSGYCMWCVNGTELGCCPTDGGGNNLDNYNNPDIDWNGYKWTQTIITAAGGKDKLNATEEAGYPATYYAVVDYENKVKSPANSSGWFLPSIGQMWNIYQNRSSLFDGKAGASGLRSDWYWSSSERYSLPASSALCVSVGDGDVYYASKRSSYSYVRPVFAF